MENPDVTEIKPRYVWIDAAANFPDYANNKENISTDMVKVKNAGFTDIIVDVRPTTGDVLFNTTAVDQVKRMDVWEVRVMYIMNVLKHGITCRHL